MTFKCNMEVIVYLKKKQSTLHVCQIRSHRMFTQLKKHQFE